MRLILAFAILTTVAVIGSSGSAVADKTKMGCDSATEVWDASLGKCQPGTPKYKRKAAEQPKAVNTAPAAKKAPVKKAPAKATAKAPAAKGPATK